MKRRNFPFYFKASILTSMLCLFISQGMAQENIEFEHRLYDLYVDGKIADWESIITEMDASYQESGNRDLLYSMSFAQYGYIGYCISKDMESEAKAMIKEVFRNTNKLEEIYKGRHDILALQGALYGYKIMLSKFSAMYLAPKCFKLINTASESSGIYFNCSLEMGNLLFYTPGFLGGSKEEAINYYVNAVEILDTKVQRKEKDWLYINTLLILAKAYYETDSLHLSCELYERIISYESKADWIREEFYVQCK